MSLMLLVINLVNYHWIIEVRLSAIFAWSVGGPKIAHLSLNNGALAKLKPFRMLHAGRNSTHTLNGPRGSVKDFLYVL